MDRIVIDTQIPANAENLTNISQLDYIQSLARMQDSLLGIQEAIYKAMLPTQEIAQHLQCVVNMANSMMAPYTDIMTIIGNSVMNFAETINSTMMPIVNFYHEEIDEDEKEEINQFNEKIITEIFQPDDEKKIDIEESPIIVLSPVNEQVLKYLSENPQAFYQLSGREFENVMAEIYMKLGYDVTLTKATRDGGKDIIIRKPEVLGSFIYYVECKKHAPDRPIGLGIVQRFVGTVSTDKVNGGIIATTSAFSPDAKTYILDNKLNCQIQMHDYNKVQELLNRAIGK